MSFLSWYNRPYDDGETDEYRKIQRQNDIAVELFKERRKSNPSAEKITSLQVEHDRLNGGDNHGVF